MCVKQTNSAVLLTLCSKVDRRVLASGRYRAYTKKEDNALIEYLATEKSGFSRKGMRLYENFVENVGAYSYLYHAVVELDYTSIPILQKNGHWPLSQRRTASG